MNEKERNINKYRHLKESEKEIKYGFTEGQKEWIRASYEEVMGGLFCIFPVWNEKEGEYEFCGKNKIEIHHIIPQGWCKRVLNVDPNIPENAAPICAEHHRTGQRGKPLTREAQDCIHIDAAWAQRNYKGPTPPTSYDKIFAQRRKLTDEEIPYWYELWDDYLVNIATDIMEEIKLRYPDYPFPERK